MKTESITFLGKSVVSGNYDYQYDSFMTLLKFNNWPSSQHYLSKLSHYF